MSSNVHDASSIISDLIVDAIDRAVKSSIDSIEDSRDFVRMLSLAIDNAVSEIDWSEHIDEDTIMSCADISSAVESEVQGLVESIGEEFQARLETAERRILELSDLVASLSIPDTKRPLESTLFKQLAIWSTRQWNKLWAHFRATKS